MEEIEFCFQINSSKEGKSYEGESNGNQVKGTYGKTRNDTWGIEKNVPIAPALLDEMYNEGSFNGATVGIQTISELMIALNISKVSELVPKIRWNIR